MLKQKNMKQLSYDEFKQMAEHPQHRDVPAVFKLEVLETVELEEGKSDSKRATSWKCTVVTR